MTTLATTKPAPLTFIDATILAANFDAIETVVNGNIDNANVSATAALSISKISGYPSDATKFLNGGGAWTTPSGSVTYHKNTTTDVVNTTTPTDMTAGSLVIAGGTIGANGIVHVTAWGDYLNNTGFTKTVSLGLKFGSATVLLVASGFSEATSATRFPWNVEWWINNQNSVSVQQQGGILQMPQSTFASCLVIGGTALAVNTASSVTLQIQCTHSSADPSQSMRCHGAVAQVFS